MPWLRSEMKDPHEQLLWMVRTQRGMVVEIARVLCPSCHQHKVLLWWGDWIADVVMDLAIPHRQCVCRG